MELLFSILWGRSTDQRQKVQLKLTSWYPWNFRTVLEMSSWEIPRDQVLSEWQLSRWILKSVCAVRTSAKTFFLRNALSNAPDPPSWTEWGSWSTCSQSCGGGQKHRERTCNSKNTLSPVHDVHTRIVNRPPDCPGNPRDTESCHNQDCPGRDYKGSRHVRKVQFF